MSCTSTNIHYCKAGQRKQFQARMIPEFDLAYSSPIEQPGVFPRCEALLARDAKGSCGDGRTCSWWWITVHPKAVIRSGAINGAPPPTLTPENFAPLPEGEILRAGEVCSSLKVKLTLSDQTGRQRELIVDVGPGFSIPWYGTAVQIDVLTFPDPSRIFQIVPIVNAGDPGLNRDSQVVEDVVIEANAVTVDACARGDGLPLTYTQVITNQGAGVTLVFPRPPGARRMAWFASSGTPTSLDYTILPGSALQVPLTWIGQVEPSPAQQNTAVGTGSDVPGPACALVMSGAGPGTYTVVWELQP